jgi:2-dehydro-3-deoxygluconokinase
VIGGRFRIVCAGEAMIEISPRGGGGWEVGYGGDTINQALHLVRFGHDVAYLTVLGGDPFAGQMRSAWGREGMDTSLVLSDPERTTGLYAISIDAQGERQFSYWRSDSAARRLFANPAITRAIREAERADVLVYSLISLAILPEDGREALLALARAVRARGGKVAFDGNYRPRLWHSADEARLWRDWAAREADFGFPTLEDEEQIAGRAVRPEEIATAWRKAGCGEVVVKLGAQGCLLPDGTTAPPLANLRPVDTSGAGDAFGSAYLSCRLRGGSAGEAAKAGHQLAAWVMMRSGAIPPRDHAAPYSLSSTASPE